MMSGTVLCVIALGVSLAESAPVISAVAASSKLLHGGSSPLSSTGCACASDCSKSAVSLGLGQTANKQWCYVDPTCQVAGWDWCDDTAMLYMNVVNGKKQVELERSKETEKRKEVETTNLWLKAQLAETHKQLSDSEAKASAMSASFQKADASRKQTEMLWHASESKLAHAEKMRRKTEDALKMEEEAHQQHQAMTHTSSKIAEAAETALEKADSTAKYTAKDYEMKLENLEAQLESTDSEFGDVNEKLKGSQSTQIGDVEKQLKVLKAKATKAQEGGLKTKEQLKAKQEQLKNSDDQFREITKSIMKLKADDASKTSQLAEAADDDSKHMKKIEQLQKELSITQKRDEELAGELAAVTAKHAGTAAELAEAKQVAATATSKVQNAEDKAQKAVLRTFRFAVRGAVGGGTGVVDKTGKVEKHLIR